MFQTASGSNSVVSVATEDRPFKRVTHFSTRAVPFCELVWPITSQQRTLLLLDVSTSQYQHLQLTGAALAEQKFDKLTCWKGIELFSKAILLPMFVYGDCMVVCSILYTCQQKVWLK
jgi:hypothetical protein